MSHLYWDIFEAVELRRKENGATEKEIMSYIQDRLGKVLGINMILRTMRTLNKLVDEGVLIKKGRRYMFPRDVTNTTEKDQKAEEIPAEEENDSDDERTISEDDRSLGGTSRVKKIIPAKKAQKTNKRRRRCRRRLASKRESETSVTNASEDGREYRSRSPIRRKYPEIVEITKPRDETEMKTEETATRKPRSEEDVHSIGSSIIEEISQENDAIIESHLRYRYRSPFGSPPPNTPGVHINRKESCCSDLDRTFPEIENSESENDDIIVKIKHEKYDSRKSLKRSSSKMRERQIRKKERDEMIRIGRTEKNSRRYYSPERHDIERKISFCSDRKKSGQSFDSDNDN